MQHADLIVFSHLRWDCMEARPRQVASRLARNRRVLFIEEPLYDHAPDPRWEEEIPERNLHVLRPLTAVHSPGFCREQLDILGRMVRDLAVEQNLHGAAVWLYTPLALPLAERLHPRALVYDCMARACGASARREEERLLLHAADLVFAASAGLQRELSRHRPEVGLFPPAADHGRFARQEGLLEPQEQARLGRPRLGFAGTLDETLDLALVDAVARARPEWHIVLLGSARRDLRPPRRSNIHYFGERSYDELPAFVSGWDVCLLPFVCSPATDSFLPGQTLDFLAAGAPVASTPLPELLGSYAELLHVGSAPESFVDACEQALRAGAEDRALLAARQQKAVASPSWDATVETMEDLLEAVLARKRARGRVLLGGAPHVRDLPGADSGRLPPVLVVGAGPAGLSAAYHLGEEALLLEQRERVGGRCRSIEDRGFTFDHAGSLLCSSDPYVRELYRLLLGENVHWQDRQAWVHSNGVHTRYPFQGSLHGLPSEVIKECLLGAIEARFGSIRGGPQAVEASGPLPIGTDGNGGGNGSHGSGGNGGKNGNGRSRISGSNAHLAGGMLFLSDEPGAAGDGSSGPQNLKEFIDRVWGAGIGRHFATPYNEKLWAVPLEEIEISWLPGRVPLPDLEEIIEGALEPVSRPVGPHARFGYPLRGGFQACMDGFLPHLRGRLELNARVVWISPAARKVGLADGRVLPYRFLVSTMPLPVLVRLTGAEAPPDVRDAAQDLRHVSLRRVNLGVGRANLTEKHWIYYPEPSTLFHRVFAQGNASPHCSPPGGFGLTCEISYSPRKPLPCQGEDLIRRCLEECRAVGLLGPEDALWTASQIDLPHAYVVPDHRRKARVALVRRWLEDEGGIFLAGDSSDWEHSSADQAFLAGKAAAGRVREALADPAEGGLSSHLPASA